MAKQIKSAFGVRYDIDQSARKFRLLSRSNPVFVVQSEYLAAGFIPAVHGVTEDGKYQTRARLADVKFVEG